MMSFELFVAQRYLRAKRKQAVISMITVISILGVAAGVMALIIALAIGMSGYLGQSIQIGLQAFSLAREIQLAAHTRKRTAFYAHTPANSE